MEIQNYLIDKGWEHKKVGNQFCLKECPFCNDEKWHFYINASTGTLGTVKSVLPKAISIN